MFQVWFGGVVFFLCVFCCNSQPFLQQALGCNTTFHLDPYFALNLTYDLHHIGDHNTCTYQFTSVYMENLIRISFPYPGPVENAADFAQHTSNSCREEENFIHIGNDLEDVGRNSWSSFLFCGDARVPPFVSRGDTAWLVVSTVHDITIRITVESLPHDLCYEDSFRCSPVECIPRTQVCDGIQQCSNGLDEYCVTEFTVIAAPTSAVCFLCDNKQCIRPKSSVYDTTGMRESDNWWLCDGYEHCQDGTDEKIGSCDDIDNGDVELMTCVPKLLETNNHLVEMLSSKRCDEVVDCIHPADDPCPEENPEKDTDTSGLSSGEWAGVAVGIAAALGLIILVIVQRERIRGFCCGAKGVKRNNKPGDGAQGTEMDTPRGRRNIMEDADSGKNDGNGDEDGDRDEGRERVPLNQ